MVPLDTHTHVHCVAPLSLGGRSLNKSGGYVRRSATQGAQQTTHPAGVALAGPCSESAADDLCQPESRICACASPTRGCVGLVRGFHSFALCHSPSERPLL